MEESNNEDTVEIGCPSFIETFLEGWELASEVYRDFRILLREFFTQTLFFLRWDIKSNEIWHKLL